MVTLQWTFFGTQRGSKLVADKICQRGYKEQVLSIERMDKISKIDIQTSFSSLFQG